MENYVGKICPVCKQEIKEGEAVQVCPVCGVAHHAACWESNQGCATPGCSEQHHASQNTGPTVCSRCGAEIQPGQVFCMKCGQKVGEASAESTDTPVPAYGAAVQTQNHKKSVLPIVLGIVGAVVIVIIAAIVAIWFLFLRGPRVEAITLSESEIEIRIDDSQVVSYTITPEEASEVEVSWTSSDEAIATVDDSGQITGKGEGSCTVTATAGGQTANVTVNVTAAPDFEAIYTELGSPDYCEVASDGSYLYIDTNMLDIDDYFDFDAYYAVEDIIAELGLPQSLFAKMGETRSIDGIQSEEYDYVSVSWSYHPDYGLEVIFELNQ